MGGDDFCMLHEARAKGEDKIVNIGDTKKKEETLMPLILPQNQEARRLETRKALDASDAALIKSKSTFAEKIDKLKRRAQQVQREQEKLRKQLIKYNNFVREKKIKVDDGDCVYSEQKKYQESISELITERRFLLDSLLRAKLTIAKAVEDRRVFRDYLQTVVESVEGEAQGQSHHRYKDIGELMKRCETLVVTRDEARKTLNWLREEIVKQEQEISAFKDAQNEKILNLSSKQNSLQDALYQVQAKKDSIQRLIDQKEQDQLDKELSIANIKLSILTLWQYVHKKKVQVSNEIRGPNNQLTPSSKPPSDLGRQLEAVISHIEDLESIIARVRRADEVDGYNSPLVSQSELRLDY